MTRTPFRSHFTPPVPSGCVGSFPHLTISNLTKNKGSELVSSFIARQVMRWGFGVDVTQIGLDEMREYPELVPACGQLEVYCIRRAS